MQNRWVFVSRYYCQKRGLPVQDVLSKAVRSATFESVDDNLDEFSTLRAMFKLNRCESVLINATFGPTGRL